MDGPFGPLLDGGPDNLVIRAARALQDHLGDSPGADLRLTKILPVASGIGGGSADAAAAFRLLMRLWNAPVAPTRLEDRNRVVAGKSVAVRVALGGRRVLTKKK